jgi:outer membrane protein assembly factor BamB
MQLSVESGQIIHSQGSIPARFPVLDAREIDDTIVVVYDYMAFPRGEPSRNLFAYSRRTGEEIWRAADIGAGPTDGYTGVISEAPLVVGNFACFDCCIDLQTGAVISKAFTK